LALTDRNAFSSGSEVGAAHKCGRAAHAGQPRSPGAASAHLLPAAVGAAPAPRSPRPRLRLPACCPPPSPPRWRRAPFACEFCGAEGRGLATLPTRRGVWGRGRRALAGTGWCWTLRRARRWA